MRAFLFLEWIFLFVKQPAFRLQAEIHSACCPHLFSKQALQNVHPHDAPFWKASTHMLPNTQTIG